jgi:hypothetical protein
MAIEYFEPDRHYEMIAKWWEGHDWPAIPMLSLPKLGLIVNNCCAGFLYRTDSTVAWMEFVVSDPKGNRRQNKESLGILVDSMVALARENGFESVVTSMRSHGLIKELKKHGFKVTDENMTNLVSALWQ